METRKHQVIIVFLISCSMIFFGCEQRSFFDLGPGQKAVSQSAASQLGENNGDDDQDGDTQPSDSSDDDDDDDELAAEFAVKNSTFFRSLATDQATWVRKLVLTSDGRCIRERHKETHNSIEDDSKETKIDKCGGFSEAKRVLAANGPCEASNIALRDSKNGQERDYRYLGLTGECVCYYGREQTVGSTLEKVRKRFARPGKCAQHFSAWANVSN